MLLRDLLSRDVVVACVNYSFLVLVDISFRTLQPIFLSTPIAVGGLGLDPPAIGTVMSFTGSMSGMFTVLFFPWMVDRLGVKLVYMIGITAAVPCFSLFPIMNYLARGSIESSGELGLEVWVAVWLQVTMAVLVCTCYGTSTPLKPLSYPWNYFRFRRRIHLYHHRRAQQGLSGSYEWARSGICGHSACHRDRTGDLNVLAIDR